MKRITKKKVKRIIRVAVFIFVITIFSLCTKSNAADKKEATVNGITWVYEISDGKAINVGPKDKSTLPQEVTIPSTLDGYSVTSIGVDAFYNCSSLTSIAIPEGVTSIGWYAFSGCSSLTSIAIPSSVTSIGEWAFSRCSSLTSIELPSSVTSIGGRAFYGCSRLTSIAIPDSVTSIGEYAFSGCSSLTSIAIPDSVTSIGRKAFYSCSSLTSIEIPSSVTSIGNYAFQDCRSLTSIEIPSSVTSIGAWAFSWCGSLTSINVSENNNYYTSENGILFNKEKTELIKYPAGKKDITKYEIPSSVTSIGDEAFYSCSSLTSIEIPSSVTSIGAGAFKYCSSLTSIAIPEGVTSIGEYAFYICSSLTSIAIPDSVTSIGAYAFYRCSSLTSIEIPSSVTSIGEEAFYRCSSLTSIVIPEGVTSIGRWAFSDCSSLTSIAIPDSVTSIEAGAFYSCSSLTSIAIPEGVTSIGDYAFKYCRRLTSIVIPEGVTSIGAWAFSRCGSLTSINVSENNNYYTSENGILFNKEKTELIKYPAGKKDITKYEIPSSVTSIGAGAFEYCSSLTNIVIPDSVTSIRNYTFSGCSSLTSIEIPSSVTSIGDKAFYDAELTIAVANEGEDIQELKLPDIIKRAKKEGDILYTDEDFQLNNCKLSEDGTKLKVKVKDIEKNGATLEVKSGALEGLVVVVVPSGTITYNTTSWTRNNVISTLHIAEGEKVTNNNESIIHEFTENGEFTYEYTDVKGEKKTATAKVTNILELSSKIYSVDNKKNIIANIQPKTTVAELKKNITTNAKYDIYKEGKKLDENEIVSTNSQLVISSEIKYELIVIGDVDGNGESNIKDIMSINKHRLEKSKLTGVYLQAGDVNGDGKVDIKDIMKINKYRLGKINNL